MGNGYYENIEKQILLSKNKLEKNIGLKGEKLENNIRMGVSVSIYIYTPLTYAIPPSKMVENLI
tara:strand:+ start:1424 stop:1615 length:192 start_codon:yes stop_codon:yes gene_type:complete